MSLRLLVIIFTGLLATSTIPVVIAQEDSDDYNPTPIIYAQLAIRDSNGSLVAYLEHYFFQIPDLREFNNFIDYAVTVANSTLVDVNGVTHEMLTITEKTIWEFEQVRTIDVMTVEVFGEPKTFVQFDHEAYVLMPGTKSVPCPCRREGRTRNVERHRRVSELPNDGVSSRTHVGRKRILSPRHPTPPGTRG